jgi:putative aldouronate transport system permease protein
MKERKNSIRYTQGEQVFGFVNYFIMALLLVFFLYPLLNMVSISMSNDVAVLRSEVTFYPKGFSAIAYDMIFDNAVLWRSFINSIFVAFVGCFLSLIMVCISAYPLAFGDFYGKKFFNIFLLFTMWFSGGMIPTFLAIRNLGLNNSLWALIVNGLLSAYYVIIAKSYFQSIPISLIESARIDGANDFTILFRIIAPAAKPVLATIALWVIVGHWNDYLYPLIFLSDRGKYTLQLVLKELVLSSQSSLFGLSAAVSTTDNGVAALGQQVRNAVLVVAIIPMILIYPFVQRYFVSGIMLGAVKE